jgi:ATP-dependent Clp protease ATP-binding subunit ClpA
LRRYIQHEIETRPSRELLSGEIMDGARVTLDVCPDGSLEVVSENLDGAAKTEPEPAIAAA